MQPHQNRSDRLRQSRPHPRRRRLQSMPESQVHRRLQPQRGACPQVSPINMASSPTTTRKNSPANPASKRSASAPRIRSTPIPPSSAPAPAFICSSKNPSPPRSPIATASWPPPRRQRKSRHRLPAPLLRALPAHPRRHRRRQNRPPHPRLGHHVRLARSRPITTATPGAARGKARAAASWSTRPRISSTCCSGTWARSPSFAALGQSQSPLYRSGRHRRRRASASRMARWARSS